MEINKSMKTEVVKFTSLRLKEYKFLASLSKPNVKFGEYFSSLSAYPGQCADIDTEQSYVYCGVATELHAKCMTNPVITADGGVETKEALVG